MGLFNNLFGNKDKKPQEEQKIVPWVHITDINQITEIEKKSKAKAQVVYKHSTTCGISKMVLNSFNSAYDIPQHTIDLYYLDLLSYRDVSNEIASKFNVIHQSPQLLVIKNGIVLTHASHNAIAEIDLNKYV